MNILVILTITILICIHILTPVIMQVIEAPEHPKRCTGTLILYSHFDEKLNEVRIASSLYEHIGEDAKSKKIRSRRQIKKSSDHLKSIYRRGFSFVSMEGNCCWKVREKRNGRGNNELLISTLIGYEPGWTIRSFELMNSCKP